tara:strand:+ start:1624 stop:1848 length:225 start_codon:yes stop_codon:yes gene_type:complete
MQSFHCTYTKATSAKWQNIMPLSPIEFPQAPTLTSPFSEQGFSLSLCLACFAESDAALLEMEAFANTCFMQPAI